MDVQDISPRKFEFDDFSLSQNPCHNFSTCFYGNLICKIHVSVFPDSFLFGQKLYCFDVASYDRGVTANIAGCNNKFKCDFLTNGKSDWAEILHTGFYGLNASTEITIAVIVSTTAVTAITEMVWPASFTQFQPYSCSME